MRLVLVVSAMLLVGCATGVAVAPHTEQRDEVGKSTATTTRVVEPEQVPEPGERAANSSGEQQHQETTPRTRPEPASVEGDVFAHCAYGPPNYGEDPYTDPQESFAVFVLERPLAQVCPSGGAECESQVVMFHVSTLSEVSVTRPEALVGRHVRLSVSEYQAAQTGHHHSRIVLWYDGVEDLGVASRKSLRADWAVARKDFLGTSCKGFPR